MTSTTMPRIASRGANDPRAGASVVGRRRECDARRARARVSASDRSVAASVANERRARGGARRAASRVASASATADWLARARVRGCAGDCVRVGA